MSDYRIFWNAERNSLNIKSFTLNNCFSYRNFRLPMSALATVYGKCIAKIDFSIGYLMLQYCWCWHWKAKGGALFIHYLISIWTTCWWNLNEIVWSKVYKILSFLTINGSPFLTKHWYQFGKRFCDWYNCLMLNY